MSNLTKQIRLILISSSLVLHGCHPPRDDRQKDRPQDQWTGSGGHSFYVGHYGGGGWGGRAGGRSGASGSVRGGFGASAHGAGS
jgi:hypothetical protein